MIRLILLFIALIVVYALMDAARTGTRPRLSVKNVVTAFLVCVILLLINTHNK